MISQNLVDAAVLLRDQALSGVSAGYVDESWLNASRWLANQAIKQSDGKLSLRDLKKRRGWEIIERRNS